jgi:hypothetical protein
MNPLKWHKQLTGLGAFVVVLFTGSVAGIAERGTNYGGNYGTAVPATGVLRVHEALSSRRYNASNIRGAFRILEYHFFD